MSLEPIEIELPPTEKLTGERSVSANVENSVRETLGEQIAELVAGDCSLHEAVDWTVVEGAGRHTIARWADSRGVTGDTVRSTVNSAREKLLVDRHVDVQ